MTGHFKIEWFDGKREPQCQPNPVRTCSVEGCNKPHRAHGYCKMHDTRLRRGSKDGLLPSRTACVQCGKALGVKQQTKYCSHQCAVRYLRGTPETRNCLSCSRQFPVWDRGGYCSLECQKEGNRAWRHEKRAKMRGSGTEKFDRREIFERDGWRCQLCGKKTRRRVNAWHPEAPTLDHIIPLSRGGFHTRVNSQCAHRRCNQQKHAAVRGQLRLFG